MFYASDVVLKCDYQGILFPMELVHENCVLAYPTGVVEIGV